MSVQTPYEEIIVRLKASDADVYALSCYVWNARLMRRIWSALLDWKPAAYVILGGPQVMRQAQRYLTPSCENLVICNGEGERTFPSFLRALRSSPPNLSGVRGLSFYRAGRLVTTELEPRISELSEIPSPFLEGLFERDRYPWVIIETNRGCPFKCTYCFWGAATGAKVHRYEESRVERELTWISQSSCLYLFIADANWGMLPRDVELSRFIVDAHKRHGAPLAVYFCASKNTPGRVAEISRVFHEAGLMPSQSVALQTLNPDTLVKVKRDNIKTGVYIDTQRWLNEHGVASFVELIWPLPGETLATFKEGIARLCEMGAESFAIYPLLLISNVELAERRDEFRLVCVPDPDPNSEAEIVVETPDVDQEAYANGIRYGYAVTSLYTLHGARALATYLNDSGRMGYAEFFGAFADYCQVHPAHPYTRFCERSIQQFDFAAFSNTGELLHLVLHAERNAFDRLLWEFVTRQGFWTDPAARLLFELGLINRPYVYRNTPIAPKQCAFSTVEPDVFRDGYVVEIPPDWAVVAARYLNTPQIAPLGGRFVVTHRGSQLPFMPSKSLYENYMYCQDMRQRTRDLLPAWTAPVLPLERRHAAPAHV